MTSQADFISQANITSQAYTRARLTRPWFFICFSMTSQAEIISQAGQHGAVTIATNIARRGTDIILGGNLKIIIQNLIQEQNEKTKEERRTHENTSNTIFIEILERKILGFYKKSREKEQKNVCIFLLVLLILIYFQSSYIIINL